MFGNNNQQPATPAEELAALKKKCLKRNGEPKANVKPEDLAKINELKNALGNQLADLKARCLDAETGLPKEGAEEADLILIAELEGILGIQTEPAKADDPPAKEEAPPTAEELQAELDSIKKMRPKKWIRAAVRIMRDFANGVPDDKRYGILGDCVKEAAELIEKSKAILSP